ncbi:MAG: PD40 domain-containing protein [Deltaproteobacteria bacterium]|nr:PD40 domain-containing protein [Deltaproteobacteria bacterium]
MTFSSLFARGVASFVVSVCVLSACQSGGDRSKVRVDLTSLQRGIGSASVSRVEFAGTCRKGEGAVRFLGKDDEVTERLFLEPRDDFDNVYEMQLAAPCKDVSLVVTVYRAPFKDEVVPVTVFLGSVDVTLVPGDMEAVFVIDRAGEVLLGYTAATATAPCELAITKIGEEPRALGPLEPAVALGLSLVVGSYSAICTGDGFVLGPQAFTIAFAERTFLELVPPRTTSIPAALAFVTAPPKNVLIGATWAPFSVQLVDAKGLAVDTDGVRILLSGQGLAGTLSTATVKGLATFDAVSAVVPGTLSFTVSAPSTMIAGLSGEIVIDSRPAASLAFAAAPAGGTIDTRQVITVNVLDALGLPSAAPLEVTLRFGPGAPGGSLCEGCASVFAMNGSAVFSNVAVTEPGTYTFVADAPPLMSVSAAPVSFGPGAPHHLEFIQVDTVNKATNVPLTPIIVELRDRLNHPLQDDNVAVELTTTATPMDGFVNGTGTTTDGQVTFASTQVKRIGPQTIGARLVANPAGVAGNPFAITITPGPLNKVLLTGLGPTTKAGESTTLTATLLDAFDNLVGLGFEGNVNLTSSDPQFVGASIGVSGVSGSGNATLKTLGPQSITGTTSPSGAVGTINTTVVPGDLDHFDVSGLPPNANPGDPLSLHVELRDVANNLVTTFAGDIDFVVPTQPGFGNLRHTFVPPHSGSFDFNFSLSMATLHIPRVDTVPASGITQSAGSLQIDPGPLDSFAFTQQPSTMPVAPEPNVAFTVEVEALDAAGNRRYTDSSTMVDLELSTNPPGAVLGGNAQLQLSSGLATFASVTVDRTGGGLVLRAFGGGKQGFSNAFNVQVPPNIGLVCSDIATPGLRVAVRGANFAPVAAQTTVTIAGVTVTTPLNDYNPQQFSFTAPTGMVGPTGVLRATVGASMSNPRSVRLGPFKAHQAQTSTHAARFPSLSADGTFIAFLSNDDLGSPEGASNDDDVFVLDRSEPTNVPERVSVTGPGAGIEAVGAAAQAPSISGDGCRIAFASNATNFGVAGTNYEIYVRDRCLDKTIRVSRTITGANVNAHCDAPKISADGNVVTFSSGATNLLPGDGPEVDVYAADLRSGQIERISQLPSGASFGGNNVEPVINADGTRIAFTTSTSTPLPDGCDGPFVRAIRFDRVTRAFHCVSRKGSGAVIDGAPVGTLSIDARGDRIAFATFASDVEGANEGDGDVDVFVRDVLGNATTRISVTSGGARVQGTSTNPQISADGEYVVFLSTSEILANPGGTDQDWGISHVFIRRFTGGPQSTQLLSRDTAGALAATGADGVAISHNAGVVALSTLANLDGAADGNKDVFVTTASRTECPLPMIFSTSPVDLAQRRTRIHLSGYGFETSPPNANHCRFGAGPNLVALAQSQPPSFLPHRLDVQVDDAPGGFTGGQLACEVYGLTSMPTPQFSAAPALISTNGVPSGNGPSTNPRVDGTGRVAVFESAATFGIDANTASDIFVRERGMPGALVRASMRLGPMDDANGGATPSGNTFSPDVSYDGNRIAFESAATDLWKDSTMTLESGTNSDIFVHDRFPMPKTRLVTHSHSSVDAPANGDSVAPRLSGNGRYVVFTSNATNLDNTAIATGTFQQVYIADLATDTVRLVSRQAGVQANGDCFEPQVDADGAHVVYLSAATNLQNPNTKLHVYYATIPLAFFASPTDPPTIDVSSSGTFGVADGDAAFPSISGDGQTIAFASTATNLETPSTSGVQVFRRRVFLDIDPVRVSTSAATSGPKAHTALDFTGEYMVFESSANDLVGGDGNLTDDVFSYTYSSGDLRRVSLRQNGNEIASGGQKPALSAFGGVVVFTTNSDVATGTNTDMNRGAPPDDPTDEDVYMTTIEEPPG